MEIDVPEIERLNDMQKMYDRSFRARVRVWYVNERGYKCSIECCDSVWTKADIVKVASVMLSELVLRIANRDTELGLSRHFPIPFIKEIQWSFYNTNGTMYASGRYNELGVEDVPVSVMTPLLLCVDQCLRIYHEAKKKQSEGTEVVVQ